MKFVIITHAEHKIHKQDIYAYEPYVREMNLWLKYVDEVKIIAPFSSEPIISIDSKYIHNNDSTRHPELDSGSHVLKMDDEMLNQVQHDETKEQIATSQTPRNDKTVRHPQLDWGSHDLKYKKQIPNQVGNDGIELRPIQSFDITSLKNGMRALVRIPEILIQIYKAMQWADHIHLRCPGNIGLLGCFIQILFPNKPKTIKYAGNWDPKSKQPLSYRIQKWIVSNTFLTRNTKVLVYGEWPKQPKNVVPFFTATYSEEEIRHPRHDETKRHLQLDWGSHDLENKKQIPNQVGNDKTTCHPEPVEGSHDLENEKQMLNQVQHDEREEQIATSFPPRNDKTKCHPYSDRHPQLDWGSHDLENEGQIPNQVGNDGTINFIFVGALTKGKQPLLSVKVVHELKKKGYKVQLDIYGDGEERENIANYILDNSLENVVCLYGNASKEIVKKAYQEAHFLLFISKSEGWPKVVAEAMFWGCLPITSNVSCIPYMLDNGSRGAIVKPNVDEIVGVVEGYLQNKYKYKKQVGSAMEWSRQFTLEKFEKEIGRLLSPLERG
tara:strand:- start:30961 stop:32613 length:1653 start_codon:yes stop_codon:yes gene_type:complete